MLVLDKAVGSVGDPAALQERAASGRRAELSGSSNQVLLQRNAFLLDVVRFLRSPQLSCISHKTGRCGARNESDRKSVV